MSSKELAGTRLSNVPSMSVGKLVSNLVKTYTSVIKKGVPIKEVPSVMLWGPPGVGKSQAVRQIAEEV